MLKQSFRIFNWNIFLLSLLGAAIIGCKETSEKNIHGEGNKAYAIHGTFRGCTYYITNKAFKDLLKDFRCVYPFETNSPYLTKPYDYFQGKDSVLARRLFRNDTFTRIDTLDGEIETMISFPHMLSDDMQFRVGKGIILSETPRFILLRIIISFHDYGGYSGICSFDNQGKFIDGFVSEYLNASKHWGISRDTKIDEDYRVTVSESSWHEEELGSSWDFNLKFNTYGKI